MADYAYAFKAPHQPQQGQQGQQQHHYGAGAGAGGYSGGGQQVQYRADSQQQQPQYRVTDQWEQQARSHGQMNANARYYSSPPPQGISPQAQAQRDSTTATTATTAMATQGYQRDGYQQQTQQQQPVYRQQGHGQGGGSMSATSLAGHVPPNSSSSSHLPPNASLPNSYPLSPSANSLPPHANSPNLTLNANAILSSSSHPPNPNSTQGGNAIPHLPSTTMHSQTTLSGPQTQPQIQTQTQTQTPITPPTSLLWTDLEPWMDAEYARQVCALMRWEAGVCVPAPAAAAAAGDSSAQGYGSSSAQSYSYGASSSYAANGGGASASGYSGQGWNAYAAQAQAPGAMTPGSGANGGQAQGGNGGNGGQAGGNGGNGAVNANNAGYCVLTFPSAAAAAAALAKVNASGTPMTMPNSARAFVLGWAPQGVLPVPPSAPPIPTSSSAASANSTASATSNNANSTSTSNTGGGSGTPNPSNNAVYPSSSNGNGSGVGSGNGSNGTGGGVVSPTSPLSPVTATAMGLGAINGGGMNSMNSIPGGVGMNGSAGVGVGGVGGPGGISAMGVAMGAAGIAATAGMGSGVGGIVAGAGMGGGNPQYPKEYSIFVGDLAPETSNSDLVAVFRNPVLGLRNDRAPKFIRPFASCKSAKIMLDPVTGVSRGYGFVRFTDEQDQQRALIEMHGLYCLSRPMRISPATAKFKPPPPDLAQLSSLPPPTTGPPSATPTAYASVSAVPASASAEQQQQQQPPPAQSVSAPIAIPYYPQQQQQQGQDVYTPGSADYLSGGSGSGGQEYFAQYQPQQGQSQPQGQGQGQQQGQQQQDPTPAEWKHHAHARAILGNLIGPNGEQLTSTDPYNTTVFVGGLSPLVGEETLRTFFVPFGEIHYVKVPVGKHCGFVQFVRKADAERAIEKMQGFPVGGSRIRLSWGRSQYKAAQAAAQAAQAAALQAASAPPQSVAAPVSVVIPQPAANGVTPAMLNGMTHEQAVQFLQRYASFPAPVPAPNTYAAPSNANGGSYAPSAPAGGSNYVQTPTVSNNGSDGYRNSFLSSSPSNSNVGEVYAAANAHAAVPQPQFTDESLKVRRDDGPFGYPQRGAYEVTPPAGSSFSPFSPDPNHQPPPQQQQQGGTLYAAAELLGTRRDSYSAGALPYPSKAFAPGWAVPIANGGGKMAMGGGSPTRGYGGGGFAGSPPAFQINRYQPAHHAPPTQPISRPNSGSARGGGGLDGSSRNGNGEEFDAMHDLNGTLASLDLDRERELSHGDRPWSLKSPMIPESASEESTSSGGSVQFRMTMGRTPSP